MDIKPRSNDGDRSSRTFDTAKFHASETRHTQMTSETETNKTYLMQIKFQHT